MILHLYRQLNSKTELVINIPNTIHFPPVVLQVEAVELQEEGVYK